MFACFTHSILGIEKYNVSIKRKGEYHMSALLEAKEVTKIYAKAQRPSLNKVSFSVSKSEFIAIMGASGSGKTTLLNLLATIDQVTAGHIYYETTDITELSEEDLSEFRRDNLGFVFQEYNLLDTLTIEENILLALTLQGGGREQIERECARMIKLLDLEEISDKFPYQVSGGQKQRCACARAIINMPKLILADEPTGALDSHSSQMLLSTMQSINEQLGATILMVTHDAFSASYANRILFLRDGVIFTEILKGQDFRKVFFEKILDVLTMMGGGQTDVC